MSDSTEDIITGVVTNNDGSFSFTTPLNKYTKGTLTISFIGYKDWKEDINLTKDIELEVTLLYDENSLDEVKIITHKKLFSQKIDRLVFNAENSAVSSGGNALDLLKFTPGVSTKNNSISIIGKKGVRVMVNGRISPLSGEELVNYLSSISSDDIKNIEVITTPPAKYDAEGDAGLINIVLKTVKQNSWNNQIRSSYRQGMYAYYLCIMHMHTQKETLF